MNTLAACTIVCALITLDARPSPDNYNEERSALLEEESRTAVGGKLHLNKEETIANGILMKWKMKELDPSYINQAPFNFSKHYFSYKQDLKKSKVYQIIRKMPKGAVLHVHSSFMLHVDVLVKLTYEDHLYACYVDDNIRLYFSETTPQQPCTSKWSLVSDLRNSSGNPAAFDSQMKVYFTLDKREGGDYEFEDINTAWHKFDVVCKNIISLINYRPVREKYWYEALKQFYEDNIMYIEVRSGLQNLYELDGTNHDFKYFVEHFKNITDKFKEEHPDFIGVKLIVTKYRALSNDIVLEALNLTKKFKAEIPDIIAGFDLVGREDIFKPLTDFLPVLFEAKDEINLYLHAGETAWLGTAVDENLVDAILLGSKRIGHGFTLSKHPSLISSLIKQDIALEVSVVSNIVLSLVHDVRNHPLATYLAMGLPVVLSSDDPGAWSSMPLSDEFFLAFMGVASKHADLRLLKQLALNSITYSALDNEGKTRMFSVFDKRWNKFVQDVICDASLVE